MLYRAPLIEIASLGAAFGFSLVLSPIHAVLRPQLFHALFMLAKPVTLAMLG